MRRVKRFCAVALCLCLCAAALAGCANQPQQEAKQPLNVYASFYPIYALTRMIVDGAPDVQLHCLVQPQDGCLRGYALSDWDFALLNQSADALVVGGSGLESFESTLYAMGDSGPAVLELSTGMARDNPAAMNLQPDSESHWQDANPHVYMNLDCAAEMLRRIAAGMAVVDAEHESIYLANLEHAEAELNALRKEISEMMGKWTGQRVIVMNEALVCAAQDLGLEIAACYARENGENLEGADLDACLNALRDCDARIVLIERQAPQSLLEALEAAGFAPVRMDTLSTRRADEGAEGYVRALRENAQALEQALQSTSPNPLQDAGGEP